jgi:hypothetical protein
MTSTSSLKRD